MWRESMTPLAGGEIELLVPRSRSRLIVSLITHVPKLVSYRRARMNVLLPRAVVSPGRGGAPGYCMRSERIGTACLSATEQWMGM
jgi:hypothetical protein